MIYLLILMAVSEIVSDKIWEALDEIIICDDEEIRSLLKKRVHYQIFEELNDESNLQDIDLFKIRLRGAITGNLIFCDVSSAGEAWGETVKSLEEDINKIMYPIYAEVYPEHFS